MYARVLAAVNEHLNSEIAARYAIQLAKVINARLYLCFISRKGLPSVIVDRAEEAMKRLFKDAEELGLQVESLRESGDVVKKIGDIVRGDNIDLVFASTRRDDIDRRLYAGTVARRLSISLPCSVALVRVAHTGKIHPREILVPLKARIGHVEERAFFTAKVAEAFDAFVHVFHSPAPVSKFFHGELHLTSLEWENKLPQDISHFMEHLNRYKIVHRGKSVPGRTGRAIMLEAVAKRHDLVIMGASERSLLSSLFKGNPVEEVLRETPCNLIILRPKLRGR